MLSTITESAGCQKMSLLDIVDTMLSMRARAAGQSTIFLP